MFSATIKHHADSLSRETKHSVLLGQGNNGFLKSYLAIRNIILSPQEFVSVKSQCKSEQTWAKLYHLKYFSVCFFLTTSIERIILSLNNDDETDINGFYWIILNDLFPYVIQALHHWFLPKNSVPPKWDNQIAEFSLDGNSRRKQDAAQSLFQMCDIARSSVAIPRKKRYMWVLSERRTIPYIMNAPLLA